MKKRAVWLLLVLLYCLNATPRAAYAASGQEVPLELQEGVQSILDDTQLTQWDAMFQSLPEEVRALWGNQPLEQIVSDTALGQNVYLGEAIQSGVLSLLKSMLPDMLPMLIGLLCIAIISGFLRAMTDAGIQGLQDMAGFVCQCFAIGIAMTLFVSLAAVARDCMVRTGAFIEMAFPVLLTLLTASGGIASSGIFQPAMSMLSSGMAVALQSIVLPVILAGGVLGVLNHITKRVQMGQLFQLSKTVAKWLIGFLFTLYFGITSLQGMTAATFDGVSIRTAKFAMDKFIPLVGGMVSGTVDTVLGCALLVKNAVGVTAIIMTISIVAVPLTKIAAGMLAFRLAAALCEPIGEQELPKMLASLADVLTYLFAATISLAVMFMITVGLMMGTGNIAVMGG